MAKVQGLKGAVLSGAALVVLLPMKPAHAGVFGTFGPTQTYVTNFGNLSGGDRSHIGTLPADDGFILDYDSRAISLTSRIEFTTGAFAGPGPYVGTAFSSVDLNGGFIKSRVQAGNAYSASSASFVTYIDLVAPVAGTLLLTMDVDATYAVGPNIQAQLSGNLQAPGFLSPFGSGSLIGSGTFDRSVTLSLPYAAGTSRLLFGAAIGTSIQGTGLIDASNTARFDIDVPDGVTFSSPLTFASTAVPVPIPEPMGLALLGTGLVGLMAARRRPRQGGR
jgi:hypothetical protein